MRGALNRLYAWSGYLAGVSLVATMGLMMVLAVGRQFGINIPDATDFASWTMAATTFLGLAHTFKRGEMIRVGLLLERLSGRTKQVAELVALSVTLAFLAYVTWHAYQFVNVSRLTREMSNGVMAMPVWMPQLSFFIGVGILTVAVVDEWISVARTGALSFEKPPPMNTDELLERVVEGGGV